MNGAQPVPAEAPLGHASSAADVSRVALTPPGADLTEGARGLFGTAFLIPIRCDRCGDEFVPAEPGLLCDWCLLE